MQCPVRNNSNTKPCPVKGNRLFQGKNNSICENDPDGVMCQAIIKSNKEEK